MNAQQLALLIELINTPGVNFPMDKCLLAHETREALKVEWAKAVESEKEPATNG